MSKRNVRIGFVGVGAMGQAAHLRNYVNLENCEVVALAEIRPKTARLVAERYGIPRVYADHRQMLAKEQLDGVVASQPFDLHAALLPEIYPHVRHVFTEKPLCVTVQSGEALVRAAAKAGCTHMVGYHKRCDPAVVHARSVVDTWRRTGEMGALKYVRLTMPAGDWIAGGFAGILNAGDQPEGLALGRESADNWNNGTSGQNASRYVEFVNYYIHQVNLMRHVLAEPYRLAYADPSGVLMAVTSESGVCGTIEMTPYRTTVAWEETALIAFEKGYVLVRLPAPVAYNRCGTVEIYQDPGDGKTPARTIPELGWEHAMRAQARAFVDVCRGEATPPCVAKEALEDLRIAQAYVSTRTAQ